MEVREHQVCLLMGSNIQPERNLPMAFQWLQKQVTIVRISRVWETPPVGSSGPNFLNAAAMVKTYLGQEILKTQVLSPLETRMGRVRSSNKNAPRPIDLDIILFDGQILDPSIWHFAHQAVPMAEIQPDICTESGQTLKKIAEKFISGGASGCDRTSSLPISHHLPDASDEHEKGLLEIA